MAILCKCPICKKLHPLKHKKCRTCDTDLDQAKRSGRVNYYVDYRLPNGKQRRESVDVMEDLNGYSLEDAKIALAKRQVQRKENRVLEMQKGTNLTFAQLCTWYLNLASVQKLASYRRIQAALVNVKKTFANKLVNDISPVDLENYQDNREKQGAAFATIDMELRIAKTMTTKAFDNDMIDGHALKAFRATKRKLKFGQNARSRIVSFNEYLRLLQAAPAHLEPIIITAMNTGMRMSEILELRWQYISNGFIRLPYKKTKEKKAKTIPINHHLQNIFDSQPRALHHGYVFTYRGNAFAEGGIKRSFKTACINASLPYGRKTENGVTFHDIRRTVKTNMLKAGVNKIYRDLILGHSLRGMDAYYIKPDDDDLKRAVDAYTVWFDGQLETAEHDLMISQPISLAGK